MVGDKEYPVNITKANQRMEYHRPLKFYHKHESGGAQHGQSEKVKPDGGDAEGDQHYQDPKKYPCFKCKRYRPEYQGARNCTFTTKKDGSIANTPEVIE